MRFQTAIFAFLAASSLSTMAAAGTFANRDLCSPSSADMSQQSSFSTTCDWSTLQPGADTNPQITFNGKQTVHGDCEFTGPDSVQFVIGKKHADFAPIMNPVNQFNFTIKYDANGATTDDNQNVLIYLNTNKPSPDDKLVCTFLTVAK